MRTVRHQRILFFFRQTACCNPIISDLSPLTAECHIKSAQVMGSIHIALLYKAKKAVIMTLNVVM